MTSTQIPPPAEPLDPSLQDQIDDNKEAIEAIASTIVYTDADWAALTDLKDGHHVRHLGRKATYYYEITTGVWSWYSGALTSSDADQGVPETQDASRMIHAADERVGMDYSSTVDGLARLHDFTRNGTRRQEQPGRSFLFDGVADKVFVASMSQFRGVSLWVNHTTFKDFGRLYSWGDAVGVSSAHTDVTGGLTTSYNGSLMGTFAGVMSLATWHHLAVVKDDTHFHTYLDGVLLGSNAFTTVDQTLNFTMGASENGGNVLNGAMRDVRYMQRALTPTEIATIANGEVGPLDAVGWWPCEDPEGVVAADISGNGNDGTVTATSASLFFDKTGINDVLSLENELTGIPPTIDPAPHDSLLASPAPTFNGTTEYGTLDERLTTGAVTDFSVSVWFQTSAAGTATIASEYDNSNFAWIFYLGTGSLSLNTSSTGVNAAVTATTGTFNDGDWHHAVLIKAGTDVDFWVDGVLVADDGVASLSPLFDGTADFAVGAYATKSTAAGVFDGQLADTKVWQSALTPTDVATLYAGGKVAGALADYPMNDGGTVFHDVSGNKRHLSVNPVSIPTMWASTQLHSDTLVKDGLARATSVESGSYFLGPRVTSGVTKLFAAAWVFRAAADSSHIIGEFELTAPDDAWRLYVHTSGVLRLDTSADGTTRETTESVSLIPVGVWVHLAATYEAGAVRFFVDGGEIATGGSASTSIVDNTSRLSIAARAPDGNIPLDGEISAVLLDSTNLPSDSQIADIFTGAYVPPTAWYWRDGNEVESQQGLADLTIVGTPVATNVPAGAGLPVTIGPGLLQPGQIASLQNGEPLSPRAQLLESILTSVEYIQGEGSQEDVLYIRQRDEGEDRLQVFDSALTGTDKDKLEKDVT